MRRQCATPGCQRAPLTSSTGSQYAHCDDCTRRYLRDAFAEPQSWHAKARAHRLPADVVGGVPIEPAPALGASTETRSPRGLGRHAQRSGEPVTEPLAPA